MLVLCCNDGRWSMISWKGCRRCLFLYILSLKYWDNFLKFKTLFLYSLAKAEVYHGKHHCVRLSYRQLNICLVRRKCARARVLTYQHAFSACYCDDCGEVSFATANIYLQLPVVYVINTQMSTRDEKSRKHILKTCTPIYFCL